MPTEPKAPVRGRHLEDLRAVADNPGGLRHEAYPTVMPYMLWLVDGQTPNDHERVHRTVGRGLVEEDRSLWAQ